MRSGVNPLFSDDVQAIFDYEASVEQYDVIGGTARRRVIEQIDDFEKRLDPLREEGRFPGRNGAMNRPLCTQ